MESLLSSCSLIESSLLTPTSIGSKGITRAGLLIYCFFWEPLKSIYIFPLYWGLTGFMGDRTLFMGEGGSSFKF